MSTLACDLDPPTHLDFALLYFKLIRLYSQTLNGPITKPAMNHLLQAEYFTAEYCKMTLADITLMSVRPSILAATAVQFGFETARKHMSNSKSQPSQRRGTTTTSSTDSHNAILDAEIEEFEKAWREIAQMLLTELADFSDISNFMLEVTERAAYINNRVGKKFTTLFKAKVT